MDSGSEAGSGLQVVTGALGYSGRAIAEVLLARGARVRTITGHPERPDPFGGRVEVRRWPFDDPAALREALRGARVLYNTYWVRFDHGSASFERAVERSKRLFTAAREAGVERVVHTSITSPSLDSPLGYFRGKAAVEQALRESGLSYAILRPAVFFGRGDVLVNNIAWLVRRLPVFGVVRGEYGLQPIHVDDFAALAVAAGQNRQSWVRDAVGPEAYGFADLVRLVRRAVHGRARIVPVPRWTLRAAARALGRVVGDVALTDDEITGLTQNLLVSREPPAGTTLLSRWIDEHAGDLGRRWANELTRHYH